MGDIQTVNWNISRNYQSEQKEKKLRHSMSAYDNTSGTMPGPRGSKMIKT